MLLFVLGKFALELYLGRSAIGSSYGAAGSLVVLLVRVGAAFRPPSSGLKPAATQGGGGIKFALGTFVGLLLTVIAAIAGAVFVAVKSVKKLLRATVH